MSQELELLKSILGALILLPSLLEACDLSADDFPAGRHRELFEIITAIWESQRPPEIDSVILAERLGDDGAFGFVSELLNGTVRPDQDNFRGRVSELRKKKIVTRLSEKIERQAKIGKLDFDEIEPDLDRYRALSRPKVDILHSLKRGSELQALDLKIEWLVDKLIPKRSVVLLHGRGGIGKTWLCLSIAKAVSEGKKFLGLETRVHPVVYIDLENSLPLLVERIRKLDIQNVLFWHLSEDPPPPKLDDEHYLQYKDLPPESLIIFDTLRTAHEGDENSSRDMALVMGRLKELRELGFTILLIHHTGKADERMYKGSTAISDLADHVLSLHKVKRSTFEEIDDDLEPDPETFYRFGTREKTRYEPFHLFLNFSPESGGFLLAEDPDQENLEAIAEFIRTAGHTMNQTEIFTWAKSELEVRKKKNLLSLLKKGDGRFWISRKEGNRRLYETICP